MKRSEFFLIGICLLLVVTAFSGFVTSEERELSSSHTGWNGSSQFYDILEEQGASPVQSFAECSGIQNATLIFVEPEGNLTDTDNTDLQTFLSNNGRIIFFARTSQANSFLTLLGSNISVLEGNISGVDVEYNSPKMLIISPHKEGFLPDEIQKIVTNHPSYLDGGIPVLTTTVFSWNDEDGDGSPGSAEPFQRFSMMAYENVSGGQIYVFSDTGMLLNAMHQGIPLQDNPHLLTWCGRNTTLFYDTHYSGPFQTGGFAGLIALIKNRTIIKTVAVFLIIFGLCATCILADRKNRQKIVRSDQKPPQEENKP